jgi:hypothetical protein
VSELTEHGRTVRRGGEIVAEMVFGGSGMITVSLPDGRVIGRLFRTGRSTGRYDVWTALHPQAPTPSDRILGQGLALTEGVALLLREDHPDG